MPIPLFVNDTQLTPSREAILARISAVVAAGRFILGPEVKAFEAELADYVGVAHAVGVANGTDAIDDRGARARRRGGRRGGAAGIHVLRDR